MNTTRGLAVAAALTLSVGIASAAADYDHGTRSKSATAAMPWRNAPTEADSFADIVANSSGRSWAVPVATQPVNDTFESDRRGGIDRPPPPAGDMGAFEALPPEGLAPVPEPSVSTLLLAGLGALGLIGLRRRIH